MWCKCFQSRLYELQNRERISLAAASKLLSNMAMLMPLSNTLIVVMIFRAWVSPWCDDRWVWQEGTRALLCWQVLILFNSIICFISKDSVFDLLLPLSDWKRFLGKDQICKYEFLGTFIYPWYLMVNTGTTWYGHFYFRFMFTSQVAQKHAQGC